MTRNNPSARPGAAAAARSVRLAVRVRLCEAVAGRRPMLSASAVAVSGALLAAALQHPAAGVALWVSGALWAAAVLGVLAVVAALTGTSRTGRR
ncbi:hypothetical protein [Kitasatospora sp. KL5]|uniref:hypothetical protein n=1 Tax=Kitasatospora sp. KL5 TaxID=3425125 RepID=UPI003D6E3224